MQGGCGRWRVGSGSSWVCCACVWLALLNGRELVVKTDEGRWFARVEARARLAPLLGLRALSARQQARCMPSEPARGLVQCGVQAVRDCAYARAGRLRRPCPRAGGQAPPFARRGGWVKERGPLTPVGLHGGKKNVGVVGAHALMLAEGRELSSFPTRWTGWTPDRRPGAGCPAAGGRVRCPSLAL